MKLLLIAGMGESVGLARELSAIVGFEVICVTEGRAAARADPPAKIYDATFPNDRDFIDYLVEQAFDMVIDAAHPFEFRLGKLARDLGLAYLRVTRPPWQPKPGEIWTNATTMKAAVATVRKGRVCLSRRGGAV